MKKIFTFFIILSIVISCKKVEKYNRVDLNYKLFSLSVNLDANYILLSRRQGFKNLDKNPPPPLIKEYSQKQNDSVKEVYNKNRISLVVPETNIYHISNNEKNEIEYILNSFVEKDLAGEIELIRGHCPIFNFLIIKDDGNFFDIERQCYLTKNQEILKNLIFKIALAKEKSNKNKDILFGSKDLNPHE